MKNTSQNSDPKDKVSSDNHANQLNPNNEEYYNSRGNSISDDDDDYQSDNSRDDIDDIMDELASDGDMSSEDY